MFVKEKMTKNPVSISPDDVVSNAIDIFHDKGFHTLPVVDKQNHVLGVVSEYKLSEHVPSKATSLSIHEINYLLNQTHIKDIMDDKPLVINPDALLEEAADLMVKSHANSMLVVDEGFLVGVITQQDIFNSFIDMQGYYNKGTRVVVEIDNDRPGILRDIATILSEKAINITHLVVERGDILKVVIRVEETDSDVVANLLKDSFKIIDIRSYK